MGFLQRDGYAGKVTLLWLGSIDLLLFIGSATRIGVFEEYSSTFIRSALRASATWVHHVQPSFLFPCFPGPPLNKNTYREDCRAGE